MTTLRIAAASVTVYLSVVAFPNFSGSAGGAVRAAATGGAGGGVQRGGAARARVVDNGPRTLAPYFTAATPGGKAPDADGFLQRWLLLEPINQSIRSNAVFTSTYVENAIKTQGFPDQFSAMPHDGGKVTVAGEQLAWHALDSSTFNVKLFRFAYGLNKPMYSVLFFAITVVDSPREMPNVRMAVGSNSASIWWLNGKEVVDLFGDRRMVVDDCVSKRLTLKKGANVIQGAVINGPGMSDFCVRFIDENGGPIKDLTVNLENTGR